MKNLYLLNMIKVVVIDSNTLYRIGLVSVLKNTSRFEVTGDYKSFNSVKPHVDSLDADIVLLGVNKDCGFDAAQYLKVKNSSLRVIIISLNKDEFFVLNTVESKVEGFIYKDAEPEEIIFGIDKVVEGERFYSSEISNLLLQCIHKKNSKSLPFLTSKEKEIIRYVMDGYSSKQIAAFLNVSPRTIDTHRANILGKFNLKNTTELVAKIAENRIAL
ncbi:LuxR C-terminal-related transcriptional regulator [Chryseosolibacter indicus]|uniref:Response regulator transcription factor n=1 Tax=Chryseosolibacter indicus TaxID=2782351 RepID=A0ABS5VXL7_9BACT|nr:response regulator transcription factor [Chryseosolibacter indicus]MBT1706071.1 response regulator transcription factor [Chryseosolibacter indicus]